MEKERKLPMYITTFRSGFRGFCGSSLRFFRKGINLLYKYCERDGSSVVMEKLIDRVFEMDGRREMLGQD